MRKLSTIVGLVLVALLGLTPVTRASAASCLDNANMPQNVLTGIVKVCWENQMHGVYGRAYSEIKMENTGCTSTSADGYFCTSGGTCGYGSHAVATTIGTFAQSLGYTYSVELSVFDNSSAACWERLAV